MVIAKFLVNAGKGIVLERIVDKLGKAYERFRSDTSHGSAKIDAYKLQETTLKEVAQKYGLEGIMQDYKESIFQRIRSYLAELKDLTSYIKHTSQLQQVNESSLYVKIQRAYDLMSTLMGQKISQPRIHAYLSDLANDYLQKIGDLNERLDRFLSMASGFNPDGSNFLGAASRRAAKFLSYQILEKKGVPIHTLENVLRPVTSQFAELRKQAKPLFTEYNKIIENLKTAYASDLSEYSYAAV